MTFFGRVWLLKIIDSLTEGAWLIFFAAWGWKIAGMGQLNDQP